MNKKIICSILSAAILLTTFPASAYAEDDFTTVTNHTLDFRKVTEDCSDSEMGWEWDADNQILTLKNFRIQVPLGKLEDDSAIMLPDDSTIKIKGENNEIQALSYHCNAIYCDGDLLIKGNGKLKIVTNSISSSAFHVNHGPIHFSGKIEITTDCQGYVIYVNRAKGSRPIVSIQDEAKIIISEDEADTDSILIVHDSSVKPNDNWLDYTEKYDDWDEAIHLVANKPLKEEIQTEPENTEDIIQANEYLITIGKADIMKNNEISYTADVVPYLNKDGYTMLPLRALLEVSNPEQTVNWNNGTKSAHTFVNNKLVSIKPGEATYTKELDEIILSTPAETVNGRLFISLRDWMSIMEIDISQLDWDAETKTVTMKY